VGLYRVSTPVLLGSIDGHDAQGPGGKKRGTETHGLDHDQLSSLMGLVGL